MIMFVLFFFFLIPIPMQIDREILGYPPSIICHLTFAFNVHTYIHTYIDNRYILATDSYK